MTTTIVVAAEIGVATGIAIEAITTIVITRRGVFVIVVLKPISIAPAAFDHR